MGSALILWILEWTLGKNLCLGPFLLVRNFRLSKYYVFAMISSHTLNLFSNSGHFGAKHLVCTSNLNIAAVTNTTAPTSFSS